MSLVWEMDLPDSEKIVLLALADCANDEGHCWPGMKSLVKKCCKTDRTVQLAIKMLVAKGHLTRREVVGKGCNYTVHPIVKLANPRTGCAPEKASPPKPTAQTPEAVSDKPSRTSSVAKATASSAADLAKQMFNAGIELLAESEKSEKEARSIIGMWRKSHGDGKVLAAILDCQAKAISDPMEWLQKRLGGVKYVSPSGYEYRGEARDVMREAERRADWGTYWKAKKDAEEAA